MNSKRPKLKTFTRKYLHYPMLGFYWLVSHKKRLLIVFGGILVSFITFIFVLNTYYSHKLEPYTFNAFQAGNLEHRETAIILGAGLVDNQTPSLMLQDRLDVGYQMLILKKVDKLILSGDNGELTHNEPQVMRNYLVNKGIDPDVLIPDYAGFRTYDTCYRAKAIFGQNKVYIITQDFHITRAIFLCKSMGIDTLGITADLHQYPDVWLNVFRDNIGMVNAFFDIKVLKPIPTLGDAIHI